VWCSWRRCLRERLTWLCNDSATVVEGNTCFIPRLCVVMVNSCAQSTGTNSTIAMRTGMSSSPHYSACGFLLSVADMCTVCLWCCRYVDCMSIVLQICVLCVYCVADMCTVCLLCCRYVYCCVLCVYCVADMCTVCLLCCQICVLCLLCCRYVYCEKCFDEIQTDIVNLSDDITGNPIQLPKTSFTKSKVCYHFKFCILRIDISISSSLYTQVLVRKLSHHHTSSAGSILYTITSYE